MMKPEWDVDFVPLYSQIHFKIMSTKRISWEVVYSILCSDRVKIMHIFPSELKKMRGLCSRTTTGVHGEDPFFSSLFKTGNKNKHRSYECEIVSFIIIYLTNSDQFLTVSDRCTIAEKYFLLYIGNVKSACPFSNVIRDY